MSRRASALVLLRLPGLYVLACRVEAFVFGRMKDPVLGPTKIRAARRGTFAMTDGAFFDKLREDMLQTRRRRFQYQLAKVALIGSVMGAGGFGSVSGPRPLFYYIAPFVAVAFDCFILSEAFTLRRMSAFVRHAKVAQGDSEFRWEQFVKRNPDRFSTLANIIVTWAAAVGSAVILMLAASSVGAWFRNPANVTWIAAIVFAVIGLQVVERKLANKTWVFDEPEAEC